MTLVIEFTSYSITPPPPNPYVTINFDSTGGSGSTTGGSSSIAGGAWALLPVGNPVNGITKIEWYFVENFTEITIPGGSTDTVSGPLFSEVLLPTQDVLPPDY